LEKKVTKSPTWFVIVSWSFSSWLGDDALVGGKEKPPEKTKKSPCKDLSAPHGVAEL